MAVEIRDIATDTSDPAVVTLGRLNRCMVCLTHRRHLSPENHLDREHIIPKQACNDHNLILGPIKGEWFNKTKVCRTDHDAIELLKGYKGRDNLLNLVIGIANYPRSPDPELYDLQYRQWQILFTVVRDNIAGLNGSTPPHLESLYSRAGHVVVNILYRWEKGDFDLLIPSA